MVKVFDLGATGHGFNPRLGPSFKVLQNIGSNSSANHISIQCMLIGSTQVLQGHCPLVSWSRGQAAHVRYETAVRGAVKLKSYKTRNSVTSPVRSSFYTSYECY